MDLLHGPAFEESSEDAPPLSRSKLADIRGKDVGQERLRLAKIGLKVLESMRREGDLILLSSSQGLACSAKMKVLAFASCACRSVPFPSYSSPCPV